MRGLLGLLVLGGLVVLLAGNVRSCNASFRVMNDIVDGFFVRQSMKHIADAVEMDYVSDQNLPAGDFSEYIRKNLARSDKRESRDLALDWWGRPYILELREKGIAVRSGGPDRQYYTPDDPLVYRLLEKFDRRRYEALVATWGKVPTPPGTTAPAAPTPPRTGRTAAPAPTWTPAPAPPPARTAAPPPAAAKGSAKPPAKDRPRKTIRFFGLQLTW